MKKDLYDAYVDARSQMSIRVKEYLPEFFLCANEITISGKDVEVTIRDPKSTNSKSTTINGVKFVRMEEAVEEHKC